MASESNITMVARLAGVSEMTVTRALNGHKYVSEATRTKVREAAERLEYRPNTLARGLRNGSTRVIGCLGNGMTTRRAQILTAELRKNGYICHCVECAYNPDLMREALEEFAERRVDALLASYHDFYNFRSNISGFQRQKHLIITYNTPMELPFECDSLFIDDRPAYREIFRKLIADGRKNFYYIGMPMYPSSHSWKEVAAEFGVDVGRAILDSSGCVQGGSYAAYADLTRRLLAAPPAGRPGAIFTHEMIPAARICRTLHEEGIRVPEDVAVIGYADSPVSEVFMPTLTSIGAKPEVCVRIQLKLLLNRLENPASPFRREVLRSSPVFRESTGRNGGQIRDGAD